MMPLVKNRIPRMSSTLTCLSEPSIDSRKIFQIYIQHPLSTSKVNILDYWRSQATELPGLNRMAMDYFSIQSASVYVERDFLGGADLVTPKRCSLYSETIQACMCMKCWYRYDSANKVHSIFSCQFFLSIGTTNNQVRTSYFCQQI